MIFSPEDLARAQAAAAADAQRQTDEWKARAEQAVAALRKHGIHDTDCVSYRVIGRFGSRSGLQWNNQHDETTCTCGLGRAIIGGT